MAQFLNSYTCPECDTEWQDEWSCGCDDDCPECGLRSISPVESIELDSDNDDDDDCTPKKGRPDATTPQL